MTKYLFFAFLFLISCGKNSSTTPSSKDNKFNHLEVNEISNLVLDKFQVRINEFKFSQERDFSIETEKLPLYHYYQILGLKDFLTKQFSFFENNELLEINLMRNEVFRIKRDQKYRYFQELNRAHRDKDNSFVFETIYLDFDIDIKDDMFRILDGIEVSIWDHYTGKSYQVGFIPRHDLRKSQFFKEGYKANLKNSIKLEFLKNLVNKEQILKFKLRTKKVTPESILFYSKIGKTQILKEFTETNSLRKYLKSYNFESINNKNIASNLNEIFVKRSFYYLIDITKDELAKEFPFLQSRTRVIKNKSNLVSDDFLKNSLRFEFQGKLFLEEFILKPRKKKLHTYVYRLNPKYLKEEKIKHHCKVYFWKKLGLERKEISLNLIEADFNLTPEKIAIYQSESKVFLAFTDPYIRLSTRGEMYQKYNYGYSHGLRKCSSNPLERTVARRPEHLSKSILEKNDTMKLSGTLTSYYIPWDEIEFNRDYKQD